MRVLQAFCNSNHTEFLHYAAKHSMNPECHMGGEHYPQSFESTIVTTSAAYLYYVGDKCHEFLPNCSCI